MSRRRLVALLAVLAVPASAAVAGAGAEPGVRSPDAPPPREEVAADAPRPRLVDESRRVSARSVRAARRADLRILRRSRTVAGALRRAWLRGSIDAATHARLRRVWWTSQRARDGLSGRGRAELGAVVRVTARLAYDRRLTPSRLEPVFLILRRNRDFWTRQALPRPGRRFVFGRDPVTFQYYAGHGLQIQPLASFGRANALAAPCVRAKARYRCRPAALRRLLDRMVQLGSVRGGFLAWEHFFSFGHGAPPWISGMTQATAAQALSRGRRALHDRGYATAARRALGAFERRPPLGVGVPAAGGGRRYAMYSFDPGLRILNGELQAVIGLRDTATILRSARARRLYARGERVARRAVRAFDTGAWSLYSQNGRESTLSYHRLVGNFLGGLCRRTGERTYCATGRRFARYVREPPRLQLARLRGLRARRPTTIRFSLSKISRVSVSVWNGRGLELRRDLRLARGHHSLRWVPAARGRHHVQIVATGPAGTRSVLRRTVRATAKPSKSKSKSKSRARARARR
ncbi:MAG TPA: D-glucuronyl C5-epimerase family protein [Solirubrobacteraceae bacterium]|nr:D-glucuronyl C5-epimerase family protein [Solirubrobacteraceae bacterium]